MADSDKYMESTRPKADLLGTTHSIQVPLPNVDVQIRCDDCGALIGVKLHDAVVPLTVNVGLGPDGLPLEIFVYGMPAGYHCVINAISRLLSCAWQNGVPLMRTIKMLLNQVEGGASVRWRPKNGGRSIAVRSIPDAVAKLLAREYLNPEQQEELGLVFTGAGEQG